MQNKTSPSTPSKRVTNRRRRVMVCQETCGLGGAERAGQQWMNALAPHADVTFVCHHAAVGIHEKALSGVHVLHTDGKVFLKQLEHEKPDTLIINLVPFYTLIMAEIRRLVPRLVCVVHAISPRSNSFLRPNLVALYDLVVVVAPYEVESAVKFGIPRAKIRCLESMVGEDIVYTGTQADARAKLDLPVDAFILGYAGRADRRKGIDYLPRMVRELVDRGIDAHLACAGMTEPGFAKRTAFWDGGLRAMHKVATEASVESHVHVFPPVRDLRPFYGALDAAVLLSDSEGSPMMVWEALANGVPVITTNVGDVQEYCVPATGSFIVSCSERLPAAVTCAEQIAGRPAGLRAEYAAVAREVAKTARGYEGWRLRNLPVLFEVAGVVP